MAPPFLTSALDDPGHFTPRGNCTWCPLDRRLSVPQSQSGRSREEKNLAIWESNPGRPAIAIPIELSWCFLLYIVWESTGTVGKMILKILMDLNIFSTPEYEIVVSEMTSVYICAPNNYLNDWTDFVHIQNLIFNLS
jgi:hypothetical protein